MAAAAEAAVDGEAEMRDFGKTAGGMRRRSSLALGRAEVLQLQLLAFYRQHDEAKASRPTVNALLADFELETLAAALKEKYGTVPGGAVWDSALLMGGVIEDSEITEV